MLPREQDEDHQGHFVRDGRWGVGALAGYNAVGPLANVVLFGTEWATPVNGLAAALTLTALAFVFVSSRRWMIVLTALFGALMGVAVVLATTWSYGFA